jgi:hypothetical protein
MHERVFVNSCGAQGRAAAARSIHGPTSPIERREGKQMANTVRFFRDSLTIDQGLISSLGANTWDTIVFCARQVVLSGLLPNHDYVIAADELTVVPNAATSLMGSPSITVMALNINGQLQITSAGIPGEDGAKGENGESGIEHPEGGGRPILLPGGDGGDGGDGADGAPGGTVTIHYASAIDTPTGSAPGGEGGRGGAGGAGGAGMPRGRRGRPGKPGRRGASGIVEISQVAAEDVWKALDEGSAQGWAAYRAEVAGFFLRKFDPGAQLTALSETTAALLLNPSDADAAIIRSRIVNRQIPSGLARDLDIAPDYPELAANLTAEIAVVQNAFTLFAEMVSLESIAESLWNQLEVMKAQVVNRRQEAQVDVVIAEQDVNIAKAEQANIEAQLAQVQEDIDKAREQSFSFGDMISDVATIAGVVAGMATGVGAIISIPAGLAALERVAGAKDLDLAHLLGELKNAPKDPKHPTTYEYDVAKAGNLGGGLKDLIKGTTSMISFAKIIGDLDSASQAGQGAVGQLLRQQAMLVRQKMVASLREKQGHARVAAAELRVNNLEAEIADLAERIAESNQDVAVLTAAADLLMRAARQLVDMVMEDVFLAQRAREIYQLDDTPDLRFDFGFLHPDDDRNLTLRERAAASVTSLSSLPLQVLSWNKIFQHLNTAQIGFDVIHPQLSLTITDPEQVRAFAGGAGLSFGIAIADVPSEMFELKANALSVELRGVRSTGSANIWITHSGEWTMNRRTDGSITEISLRPRSEVFAFGLGDGTLKANIPAHPQSNSEAGPPFSFWGRGVVTRFDLEMATPSVMDLTQLTSIHITLDCLAFARQGAVTLSAVKAITPAVQLTSVPLVSAMRARHMLA